MLHSYVKLMTAVRATRSIDLHGSPGSRSLCDLNLDLAPEVNLHQYNNLSIYFRAKSHLLADDGNHHGSIIQWSAHDRT